MKIIADIHLHSYYSRATSKDLNLEHLHKWAQLKGVQVVGTGDIAHPGWLKEMKEKLEPTEEGLFRLKDDIADEIQTEVPRACHNTVRFMLAGEISNIYKKDDKVRKVHNVVFLPSFQAVEKFQAELEKIGNIRSDGRPILGLDVRDLLEIVLQTDPQAQFIPAHIWTPWFSLFGSMSGFDSIEECFEDLTEHIFALETGLSSDPPMNWRLSALDRYTLVSNSDAHSPQKLAREANLFHTELSYPAMFEALKTGNKQTFLGTIEFFPEEGKYHYDGHRKCGIRWNPKSTLKHNRICPVCGKKVTVGVMHRVEVLADREEGEKPEDRHPFHSLIPLPEVLAQVHGVGPNTKRVSKDYDQLLSKLGSELFILQDIPLEDIRRVGGTRLAEGIHRMRKGQIEVVAGYDGEYGVIKLFDENEETVFTSQMELFGQDQKKQKRRQEKQQPQLDLFADEPANKDYEPHLIADKDRAGQYGINPAIKPVRAARTKSSPEKETQTSGVVSFGKEKLIFSGLNPQQREAVQNTDSALIIVAGPGTGKTRTLSHRIAYLIDQVGVSPESILAITFTNKAAREMNDRLSKLLSPQQSKGICVQTFHAFGMWLLRQEGERFGLTPAFSVLSESNRKDLFKTIYPDFIEREVNARLEQISLAKNQLLVPDSEKIEKTYANDRQFVQVYRQYDDFLRKNNLCDFDDLILLPFILFKSYPDSLPRYQRQFRWISVDEYQDVNDAQYQFLKLLTGEVINLCVIGDPDQAIYGFRGANREYFLRFHQDFPNARTIRLNRNYRSTQPILNAAGQMIASSTDRNQVDIWSDIVSNARLEIYEAATHKAEAEYVVHQIESMVGGTSYFSLDSGRVDDETKQAGLSFSDFAVLYRIGVQSQFLIEAFQRSGIPYQTGGQTPFYERREIQELLNYLWYIFNPDSPFHQRKIEKRFHPILPLLEDLRCSYESKSVSDVITQVDEFIKEHFKHASDEKRTELIGKLVSRATPFGNRLEDFLQSTVLEKETDEYDPRADRITLMTLHASKGLEFPVVFIVGCEENLIPYQRKGQSVDLEEERRLLYVGMTRARDKLVLTHAKKRFLLGKTVQNSPSRFLNDIETALIEIKQPQTRPARKEKPDNRQLTLF